MSELPSEMINADFGDARLSKRLASMVGTLESGPGASFPSVFDDAGLEGAYRFWNNARVTFENILEPHIVGTVERAACERVVRLIHDTSEFQFEGQSERPGLGRLRSKGRGFLAHVTLAASGDEDRRPLGIVAAQTWTRGPKLPKQVAKRRRLENPDERECVRWHEQAILARQRLGPDAEVVHLMDREADSYELLCALRGNGHFVIRAMYDRVVRSPSTDGSSGRLQQALSHATWQITREVFLSPRAGSKMPVARRMHPQRHGRLATLAMSAMTVQLQRTVVADRQLPEWIDVNVVRVVEIEPPRGEPPIDWTLLTDLPISTAEDVEAIVDHYRARWLIEEFFKALKTGCSYEQRQLESYHALANALATFLPIAWRLLLLRTVARTEPTLPATVALTPTQLDVLRAVGRVKLPPRPTLREGLLAVAALGGHLKNNGEPGWQVLWRGMTQLLAMEVAWTAAASTAQRQQRRSDQS
jgi:hypothetical protein